MAPIKPLSKPVTTLKSNNVNILTRGITLRSQQNASAMSKNLIKDSRVKRKAECSPLKEVNKENKTTKRAAFCDLTNEIIKSKIDVGKKNVLTNVNATKKVTVQSKYLPTVRNVPAAKYKNNENIPIVQKSKNVTRSNIRVTVAKADSTKDRPVQVKAEKKVVTRQSDVSEKSEDSLYVSAIEDINDPPTTTCDKTEAKDDKKTTEIKHDNIINSAVCMKNRRKIPPGVNDFDKENWDDIFQASHYAMDIFEYLKSRESAFKIRDYMSEQKHISSWMRSLLVDWMVEVQESFELNHETLYLAVKLVDIYLNKICVKKELLQLVGAAALFIASKFDERVPPVVDDFLYICDGAYKHPQLIKMEMNLLKICDYQLGIPLSYRFLRRYARCAKVTMPILTLARYILESSLLDYSTVMCSDSKLAAAALYIALRMKDLGGWTETLEYYSGYKLIEFMDEVKLLNNYLHKTPNEGLSTIRNKYSHKIFFEVAKIPLVTI